MIKYFLVDGKRVRIFKEHCTKEYLTKKYPEHTFEPVKKPPTHNTLENWILEGYAQAIDGCTVELDGYCQHGKPSWLLTLGYI